jgi:hypothetical protein
METKKILNFASSRRTVLARLFQDWVILFTPEGKKLRRTIVAASQTSPAFSQG